MQVWFPLTGLFGAASLGLATSDDSQARLDDLIDRADRALYLGRRAV